MFCLVTTTLLGKDQKKLEEPILSISTRPSSTRAWLISCRGEGGEVSKVFQPNTS